MAWFARVVLATSFGIFLATLTAYAATDECKTTANCSATTVCVQPSDFARFFGWRAECKVDFCNADSFCPSARPLCLQGICQADGNSAVSRPISGSGSTGGGSSSSSGRPGEGKACGRVKIGHTFKNVGCPGNLFCDKGNSDHGSCRRPQI